MSVDKIRICVVGTGRAGMIHARNFSKNVLGATITAIVDPVEEALELAANEINVKNKYPYFQKALENCDFDAVVVVSPTKYHKDIAVKAANAGKHIFCEKPMAMNESQCDEIIQAAKKNNVKLQIGFMRRFDNGFVSAKERIEAGEIGDVVMVRSLTYGPSIPKPWMYDISKSNGPLAEVNSHDIDTLRWYTGSEFREVYAVAGNYRCPDAKNDFPDFYDNVAMTVLFDNGMQGSISGAQGVRYGYDCRCEILGTNGIIFVGSVDGKTMISSKNNGANWQVANSWTVLFEDAYLAEDKHFIECILEDKEPRITGEDGARAIEVMCAVFKSMQTGAWVDLPLKEEVVPPHYKDTD